MKIKKGYVIKQFFDTYVLINIKSGNDMVFKLNATSKEIVEGIIAGKNIDDICEELSKKYEENIDGIRKDTIEIVGHLIEKGIISND